MACKSCEERRQMIASAYKAGGVKDVIKRAPAVAAHLVRNRPAIIRKAKA